MDRPFDENDAADEQAAQPRLRFSLWNLFGVVTLAAVLAACVKCGGPSGIVFAISALVLVGSLLAASAGRRRLAFWISYVFVLLFLLALLLKLMESAVWC
jgi:hypothetical protein